MNCIEPHYQSYKMQVEPSPETSQDAAAASAAANVLMQVVPNSNIKATLTEYLAKIPDGPAKDRGIKLGEEVAAKVVKMRANDGSTARNAYRPVTEPGKYIPTAFTGGWQATEMTPFVLDKVTQFRPGPPPDLTSDTRAKDYNEIKDLGDKNSTRRTPQQTETARLWLAAGPIAIIPGSARSPSPGKCRWWTVPDSWRCFRWPRRMPSSRSTPPSGTTCSGDR